MKKNSISKITLFLIIAAANIFAQPTAYKPAAVTAQDYDRAVKMLSFSTNPLVDRAGVRPTWPADGRFWYQVLTPTGKEFILVNPADGSRTVKSSLNELGIPAAANNQRETPTRSFRRTGKSRILPRLESLDARYRQQKEIQLTVDGVENFGYATDNAGWTHSDRAILRWSPDSKKIATFQQDQRGVTDMYLVTTNVGAPKLEKWKYPLPGDPIVTIQRVIIETETPRVIRLQMPPDARRSTLCDDISCDGSFSDTDWSADSSKLAFVSTTRDHKQANLRVADVETGAVRDIHEERVRTQYESGQGSVNWRYLPASNEFIWYSERDDWGHCIYIALRKIEKSDYKRRFCRDAAS